MRRMIVVLLLIVGGAGAFLLFRHRPDGADTEPYSAWDAEMDEFSPQLNKIAPDDIGVYPAMPYFFRDIGQAAVGKPIPGLPADHPLAVAEANLSMHVHGLAAQTAIDYVGPTGENYDPGRPECRAAAALLATMYSEPEHVPVLPMGLFWLGTVVGDHDLRTMYSERIVTHPREPRCTIHCYRLRRTDFVPGQSQPLAFVLKDGSSFVGAFAVERNQTADSFELKYFDYEGLPLLVDKFGPTMPDESAVESFVTDFTPFWHPSRGSYLLPYTIVRAELESLLHSRNEVTPLAARWAAYARFRPDDQGQGQDPPLSVIATQIRDNLRARYVWAWKIESDDDCDSPRDGESFPAYRVQGYRNMSLEGSFERKHSNATDVEHYHFTVFSASTAFPRQEYLLSYRLMSRMQNGARRFALEQLLAGIPMWIQSYDELPSFEEVRAAVTNHLEMNNQTPHGQ